MRQPVRSLPWAAVLLPGALLVAAAPAPAQIPRDCLTGAAPRLLVERKALPVALDGGRTIAALSADLRPGAGRTARALGKAEVEHRLVIEPTFAIQGGAGAYCAIPTEVRLIVHDVRRTIYVAREVVGDACLNREVLAHEQRHIRADEQVIDAAIAGAEPGLRAALARRPLAPSASPDGAATATRDVVVAWFETLRDAIQSDSTRLNAEIDSPEEYRRLSTVCGRDGTPVAASVEAPPTVIATAETARGPQPLRGAPINPAPPAPQSPEFRGTIEPLDGLIVIRLRPLAERAVVTVTVPAGAPNAREIAELRLSVVRQGNDLVHVRRPIMPARGLAGRWVAERVTTDVFGALKAVSEQPEPAASGDIADPLQVFASELAPRLTRAMAEIEQPRFPARGVEPGDVVNQAAGDDGVVRYDSRMTVRGVTALDGRPALVVDHASSIATIGPSLASRGYRLIDLETGALRYADYNQVTTTGRADQAAPQLARVITSVVER